MAEKAQIQVKPTARPAGQASSGSLQRKCACGTYTASEHCDSCKGEGGLLQRKASSGDAPSEVPAIVHDVLRSSGQPLDATIRAFFEPRFAHDFSHVRVHTDVRAAESAKAVNAVAYTVGSNIVFGTNRYRSDFSGAFSLAHELAHVTQASRAGGATTRRTLSGGADAGESLGLDNSSSSPEERQADRMALAVLSGRRVAETPISAKGIRRQTSTQSPGTNQAAGGQVSPPTKKDAPGPNSFTDWLSKWRNAGLLDPPFRPENVDAIPLPEAVEAKAEQQKKEALVGPGATMFKTEPKKSSGTKVNRPTREESWPKPFAAEPETAAEAKPESWIGGLFGSLGKAATLFASFMFMSQSTGPEMSYSQLQRLQLDDLPLLAHLEGLGEWYAQLTAGQRGYLRTLYDARTLKPEPGVEDEPARALLPATTTLPESSVTTHPKKSKKPCFSTPITRKGSAQGSRSFNYATKVSGSTEDYFVRTSPTKLELAYDGLTPPTIVWEAKLGYGWFFNADLAGPTKMQLTKFDAQKNLGMAVAQLCGYSHKWGVSDKSVAAMLNTRWGGTPPVLNIPE